MIKVGHCTCNNCGQIFRNFVEGTDPERIPFIDKFRKNWIGLIISISEGEELN